MLAATGFDARQAVGKLITGKVDGLQLTQERRQAIGNGIMGGVTLFKENAGSLEQLFDLIGELHKLGGEDFLIAVDQEGGAVQRFDDVLTPLPSPMALASLNDIQTVVAVSRIGAAQLGALGVNCNLTPVLDVNSNPLNPIIGTRSFGDNPHIAAQLGLAVAEAHLSEGVLPVGKHFPGHGDTLEDSHLALAVAHADKEKLHDRELKPFALLADKLPAMLIGHVYVPAYDAQPVPASLSPVVTEGLLRTELGFKGFLLTDDLPVMKAIVDHYGLAEAAIMAVNAGADNLLVSGTVQQVEAVYNALLDAVLSGVISQSRVQEALARRSQALLQASSKARQRSQTRLQELVSQGCESALQASAQAIAVVRGLLPPLPRQGEHLALLIPQHARYRLDLLSALVPYLKGQDVSLHERRYSLNPPPDEIEDIVTFAKDKQCILLTYRALLNKGQLALAYQLAPAAGTTGLVVACDVPYELSSLTGWSNAAATFDPSVLAMQALAAVLTGNATACGVLPVSMPEATDF